MSRKEYTSCMTPHMKGVGKTKEQRQKDMCIGAKLCSGKASSAEEAKRICDEAALNPKTPKTSTRRQAKSETCETNVHKVAECVVNRLVNTEVYKDQALNINSVGTAITNALLECQCQIK